MSSEEYPHPLFSEDKKVVCQICGKPFQVISPKHLAQHNLRYAEYKLRFPDAPLSNSEFAASSKYGKNGDSINLKSKALSIARIIFEIGPAIEITAESRFGFLRL